MPRAFIRPQRTQTLTPPLKRSDKKSLHSGKYSKSMPFRDGNHLSAIQAQRSREKPHQSKKSAPIFLHVGIPLRASYSSLVVVRVLVCFIARALCATRREFEKWTFQKLYCLPFRNSPPHWGSHPPASAVGYSNEKSRRLSSAGLSVFLPLKWSGWSTGAFVRHGRRGRK